MAVVDSEVLASRGPALRLWITRQPSAVVEIPHKQLPAQVIEQVVDQFRQRRSPAAPLEYRHPMGSWKPYTPAQAETQLKEDIEAAFRLRDSMDVARGISGIKVATHAGLPDWRMLRFPIFGPTGTFILQIDEWTRLGSGGRVFDSISRSFSMTQKPGEYPSIRRTVFRELRV